MPTLSLSWNNYVVEISKFNGEQRKSVRKEFWIIQTRTEEHLYSWLTMFWCERGIDTCDPPGRICCCRGPCTPRAQTRSRWPRHTRCCGRNLPGPPRLRRTQPARCLSLKDSEMSWLLLQKPVKKSWVHWLLLWGETKQRTPGGEKWGKRHSPEDITVYWI